MFTFLVRIVVVVVVFLFGELNMRQEKALGCPMLIKSIQPIYLFRRQCILLVVLVCSCFFME